MRKIKGQTLSVRIGQNQYPAEFLDPAHKIDRTGLLVVIKKEGTMRQTTDQMIAPAGLDRPALPHGEQYTIFSGYCTGILYGWGPEGWPVAIR